MGRKTTFNLSTVDTSEGEYGVIKDVLDQIDDAIVNNMEKIDDATLNKLMHLFDEDTEDLEELKRVVDEFYGGKSEIFWGDVKYAPPDGTSENVLELRIRALAITYKQEVSGAGKWKCSGYSRADIS